MIDTKAEENAVYNELLARGYAGTIDTHFWLGLRQIEALKNGQVDQGWMWLDGRPLDPAMANWRPTEPNDWNGSGGVENGDEDYAQFDFDPSGITWNDMADNGGGGNSWPIFEFTGTTAVKWYKQEVGGVKTEITGFTSNSLKINPASTTTYFYEVEAAGLSTCSTSITITVNDPPTLLSATNMVACDNNLDGDPTNTNKAAFDLAQQKDDILSSSSSPDRKVFFYESNPKALAVADSVSTSSLYTNIQNPQTLHYRIQNTVTGCFSATVGTFDLIVQDLPPEISISDFRECDDTSAGNDKDGKRVFDLTQKTSEVFTALGGTTADYEISYHLSLTDAQDPSTAVTSYITADYTDEKEIFVRIKSNATGCVRYDNSFNVGVDKLPELTGTSYLVEQCETDGEFKYNLTTVAPRFSSNYMNETFEFYRDAGLTNQIINPESFTAATTTNIYLKIINNDTGCERFDDQAEGASNIVLTLMIGTNSVPTTFSPLRFIRCFDSETDPTPGYDTFGIPVFEDIADALILASPSYNAPNVEVMFYESQEDAIFQQNEIASFNNGVLNLIAPYTNSDQFNQEIWAGVEDIGLTTITCLGRLKVADLIVTPNPTFDLPEEFVFCKNYGFDTISVTNPSDAYTYAWERNGVAIPLQTSQDLTITQGGTYSVTATNPTTGCSTTKIVGVMESEKAYMEPEYITVYDLTGDGSNRIEIRTGVDLLGIGDYEFALNDGPFQDNPIFENVSPGIHTVVVRDKNGCGIQEINVSVIGYTNFFTPNGDNKNDTWQILGVSDVFQSESIIYIFDRHGRLMAQIAADGAGWDGTYNGTPMPADDYWFQVKLEDGRSFTGHFSLVR